ncbi:MAG TPA: branched-chain amino acid ABC transporter permease/ATP-binding protein [Solirubrobacteraceae bacterium]|nr:branched-chain amino acid ABC transporter permease/ATP-binding protein [Solirubrobacteraceae bacterium]
MQEVIQFALLGIGVGALYSLASQGLIVIYRGSGVLNFGLGAIGMVGAYLEYELTQNAGWAFIPALVLGVLASALVGALVHIFIMRPLRNVSPIMRVIATLGVMVTLQAIAVLRYNADPRFVPSALPLHIWHLFGSVTLSSDRVILLAIGLALTVGLWLLYRFTKFGLGTTAVAENQRSAASLGWSPDRIATINWALGSGLAGLAAILIVPIITLQPEVLTNLVLAATAAALVASFRSFPIAFITGLVMGIAQAEGDRYIHQPGVGDSFPLLLIVVWMLIRGRALPLRDYLLQRLPTIGSGRPNWRGLVFGVAVAVVLIALTPAIWIQAITVTFAVAMVLLSIVVLTGYAGQLSLAQYAIAGFGAYVSGRLMAADGWPFWLGCVAGVVAALPLGMLFAIPAVRTRGINLAILTLGLGSAIEVILFDNQNLTGGVAGTIIHSPTIAGFNIDAAPHPARYAYFVLVLLVIVTLAVGNIRRGRTGRRMIAVRTNERAAAALGISVRGVKLYAFGLSASIAALGGMLIAFQSTAVTYSEFANFNSISDVGYTVVGGIGFLLGPLIGGTLTPGGFDQQVLESISQGLGKWIPLIGGVSIILLVLLNQNGIAKESIAQIAWLRRRLSGAIPFLRPRERARVQLPSVGDIERVAPQTLEATGITVRYGGTVAVDDVSLVVPPGRIIGLIGPNGAGKTTFIDAVTGFARPAAGTLSLDGRDISRWSAERRARAGLGRSFQSLELFEDSTVFDNLRAASDPRDSVSYLRDLVYPFAPPLPGAVVSAIKEFRLEDDLERLVEDLPYGQRRLLAIARAVATQPGILLLDEPAAGLGDVESSELADVVRRLASEWGIGILLVEHDMNFVMSVCDEIVVLDFGRKIAQGAPEQVRNDPAVIAAYLGEPEEAVRARTSATPSSAGAGAPRDGAERKPATEVQS